MILFTFNTSTRIVYITMSKERKIIDSIKSGEHRHALDYLYESPLRKVRTYILKNNGSKEDAKDIFQDAVIVLFNYIRENKFDTTQSLEGFIYSVARNLWIDKVRKDNRLSKDVDVYNIEINNEAINQLDQLVNNEKSIAMSKIFNQLDEKCKKILSYVIYHKLTMKEIKDKMGYANEDVAKSNHYRCKQYLSKLVKSDPEIYNTLKN